MDVGENGLCCKRSRFKTWACVQLRVCDQIHKTLTYYTCSIHVFQISDLYCYVIIFSPLKWAAVLHFFLTYVPDLKRVRFQFFRENKTNCCFKNTECIFDYKAQGLEMPNYILFRLSEIGNRHKKQWCTVATFIISQKNSQFFLHLHLLPPGASYCFLPFLPYIKSLRKLNLYLNLLLQGLCQSLDPLRDRQN